MIDYWCKAATVVNEPIMCRVVTNFTYSPSGVITAPNKVRWQFDSSDAVFSRNSILGNGYATHVRKFSYPAAGTYRVKMRAFKDNRNVIIFICPIKVSKWYCQLFVNFTGRKRFL